MARFILETAGEDITVGGADVNVIGTNAGGEVITVVSGDVTLDASFAQGGDTIELPGEAEDYTAVLNGSRVIISNGAGMTVSIPVGTAGIGVDFGGDDTRVLVIDGDAVTFGTQTITGDEADLDPGTDEATTLTQALQSLQAAQTALDEFLAANDLDDNPATDTTEADVEAELTTAQGALTADLADGTDAQLAAAVTAEQADVAAVEAEIAAVDGLEEAIEDYEAAEAELDAATDLQTQAAGNLAAALARYNTLNGTSLTVAPNGEVAGLIELNSDGELVFEPGVTVTPAATALLEASRAQEAADEDVVEAQADFDAAEAALVALDPGMALYNELQAEQAELAAAQADVTQRAELRQDVADAQDLVDQMEDLQDAIGNAEDAIEGLGYEVPVTVSNTSDVDGTAANDIFLLNAGTGVGSATIGDFGDDGDDILFVGSGYTTVELESTDNLAGSNQGDAGQLEVFIQQVGNDTVLYFEDEAFAGNTSTGTFQGFQVTLEDVDASTVSLDATGYITIEESATVA